MNQKYKNTEYGKIPVEWEFVKLNEVFTRITTKNKEENKNVLTISAQHGLINQEEFFNKSVASKDNTNYYLLEKDDFAYNKSYSNGYPMGAIKKLERYNKGVVSPLYICFRMHDKNSNCEFYKYYFEHSIFNKAIASIAQEGARNHGLLNVGVSDFFELSIFKPPLKEQEKIAEILSTVDSQIDDTDKLIEKTKELKKGLMQRLLTKGIGHTEFKKTEVGEIPIEWEVKSLFEVANFNNGKAHEKNISEEGQFVVVNSKFISTEGEVKKYCNENICPLDKGDIVIVMSDVPNGRAIGKCYLIDEENKYTLNQRIGCLKTEYMHKKFLFYYLNRNKYYLKFDDGVKQTNLKKEEVLGCPVIVPDIEEQKKIVNILETVDFQIDEYKSKKTKLEELKTGLMQQLLTGKIRVV